VSVFDGRIEWIKPLHKCQRLRADLMAKIRELKDDPYTGRSVTFVDSKTKVEQSERKRYIK
jgi:hypothetical protein